MSQVKQKKTQSEINWMKLKKTNIHKFQTNVAPRITKIKTLSDLEFNNFQLKV